MSTQRDIEIVEVAPRDGFQSVPELIPTRTKIAVIEALYRSGLRRIEVASFVGAQALPQMADAAEVLAAAQSLPGLDAQVLVPNSRHAARALAAGAMHLAFVLSVSDSHNRSNVRRSPDESAAEYAAIRAAAPIGIRFRLNIATAFDCPYEGRISADQTLGLLETLLQADQGVEVALCDTTGRVGPAEVSALFAACRDRLPEVRQWAFHAHDTYGLGAANTLAAWQAGVRVVDASAAGLGGCPFAPGATGNVATEDVAWMFERMGLATGIDLDALAAAARTIVALPGAQTGGRVRDAMMSRSRTVQ